MEEYRESSLRSLVKTFIWRIIATLITFIIAYLVTGELSIAAAIGGIEVIVKSICYYFYERIWQYVPRNLMSKLS
ncbi:MAG: DUF2061 domain-containing protein [Gammaproteobacteria bacterium]